MWALINYDLNSAAQNASQILSSMVAVLGSRGRTQLLGRCWLVQVRSEDDFDALGAGLESLHGANPAAFDYFALGYHPEGGPVRWSPRLPRWPHAISGATANVMRGLVDPKGGGHAKAAQKPSNRIAAGGADLAGARRSPRRKRKDVRG